CGGIINSDQLEITTPGYPNGYPPNSICHWLITFRPGEVVTVSITDQLFIDRAQGGLRSNSIV
ncbi:hypothetical protein AVEN_158466-1, partial [Araneus ventricosus]